MQSEFPCALVLVLLKFGFLFEQASRIQLQGIQNLTKLEISGFGSDFLTFPILGSHFWLC